MQLLISFILVTLGWQLVARTFGPVLAKRLYANKMAAVQVVGGDTAASAASQQAVQDAIHMSLLILAAACGLVAGVLNFPLIGFSRSTNARSWIRLITLCGVSWAVAIALHGARP
jgi:ascorbate-specific PTS system EIIC-type component UlaA